MNKCFLITAGGTGAKVAESVVHLCAAGLGPLELHVLLVDMDVNNGNVSRTLSTLRAYAGVAKWPWGVACPSSGKDRLEYRLFGTELHCYKLRDEIGGSLRGCVEDDTDLLQFLEVLLDSSELESDCSGGFCGRPNLGCLIVSGYLEEHLLNPPPAAPADPLEPRSAADFLNILLHATRNSAGASLPIFVAGSVFGGTGASLLPVAKEAFRQAFRAKDGNGDDLFERLNWGKLLQLPYFKPAKKTTSTDPSLYLLNTRLALKQYGVNLDDSEPCYVIGSNRHQKKEVSAVASGDQQSNPAFFHEVLGALACVDFFSRPKVPTGSGPIRLFHPDPTVHDIPADLRHVPSPDLPPHNPRLSSGDTAGVKTHDRLAILIHLVAFFCAKRANDDIGAYKTGLYHYLSQISSRPADLLVSGFYGNIVKGWALSQDVREQLGGDSELSVIANLLTQDDPNKTCALKPALRKARAYFQLAYNWAETAFANGLGDAADESVIGFDSRRHYVSLHNTICRVMSAQIDTGSTGKGAPSLDGADNLVARLLRATVVGLIMERENRRAHHREDYRIHLRDNDRVIVPVGRDSIRGGINVMN